MAARKTPEERALADVEKAMKDYETAVDKRTAAEQKADEARAAEHRALRTLEWTAKHPDLADDFDLAELARSLKAPFEDATADDAFDEPEPEPEVNEPLAKAAQTKKAVLAPEPEADVDPVAPDEGELAAADEAKIVEEKATLDAADADDDDPWGDDA